MSLLLLFQNNLASGGSVTTSTISESATSVEVSSAIAVLLSSISEAGNAVEVESAVQVFAAAISESGAATELISAAQIVASSILEPGNATDIGTATQVLLAAIAESGIATETQSNVLTALASIIESGTSTEVSSTIKLLQASILEAATATEVESVLQIFVSSVLESAAATDSENAIQVASSSISESNTAVEVESAIKVSPSSITETANATETESALQISSALISDAATAMESQSALQVLASAILESGAATESESAAKVLGGSILEAGSAAELEDATKISLAAISESAAAVEIVSFGGAGSAAILELGTATELESGLLITLSAISESSTATDSESISLKILSAIIESVTSTEIESSILFTPAVINEVASGTETSNTQKVLFATINESLSGTEISNAGNLPVDTLTQGSASYISQMITELFIEGKRVDISADLSSLLTFAIDDVKDFASRQTTFSKTVTLPGTANNNALFGNIFETGSSNAYTDLSNNIGYNFNASKSAQCLIFQDNLQVFRGTLRLLQINKDRQNIEYEVALNGEITTLSVALSSKLLDALDFSAYDSPYNAANIVASWDNPGGSGVYYPLMDYGNSSLLKHDWDIKTFRPALYVKEYLDKIFASAGFRYNSAIFNTARFKSFIVPHAQKGLTRSTTNLMSNSRTTLINVITYAGITTDYLTWQTVSSSSFTNISSQQFQYSGTDPLNVTVNMNINFEWRCNGNTIIIELKKNGTTINSKLLGDTGGFNVTSNFWNASTVVSLVTNDILSITATVSNSALDYNFNFRSGTLDVVTSVPVLVPVVLGNTIKVNDAIPKNIRQIEFLTSIVKLFNLYVFESQFDERLINISPFVDFYSTDSRNAVDWTYKLNRDKSMKIKPLSEINSKTYNFKYKDDSDYWNDVYKKRYNQGYGSYSFDSAFEFASQTNTLELIFAGTPLVGYAGQDKVYSTIFKLNGTVEEQVDSAIRILQTKKIVGVSTWDIKNGGTVLSSQTNYGYAGHFNNPDNPTNDLNFGVSKELFFTVVTGNLSVTQFNVYWSSYMAEITDKDSKMLIAYFHLTPKDIFNLDFSKYVYVDGVLFRLNKINDYNTTIPSDCEVQLLRVINTIY